MALLYHGYTAVLDNIKVCTTTTAVVLADRPGASKPSDVGTCSNLGVATRTGIFPHKKYLVNVQQVENN